MQENMMEMTKLHHKEEHKEERNSLEPSTLAYQHSRTLIVRNMKLLSRRSFGWAEGG